jgi:hypothetical protein
MPDQVEDQQTQTPETTTETPTTTKPDPLPREARELLKSKAPGLDELLDRTRAQESQKVRGDIEATKKRAEEAEAEANSLKARLAEIEGKNLEAIATRQNGLEQQSASSVSALEQRLSQLETSIERVLDYAQTSSIQTRRSVILSQLPEDTLPKEFHSLVKGTTDEELQNSLEEAISVWSLLKQKTQPQQSQQQPGFLPVSQQEVNPALGGPENGGTLQQGVIPTADSVREMAQRAMRTGGRVDQNQLMGVLDQADQVINAELLKQEQ